MISFLKKLFGPRKPKPPTPEQIAAAEKWYDEKSRQMEDWLGPEHDHVMHAIIPYAVGGGLDLYYYPRGVNGTAIATKELSEWPGHGSKNRAFACYELVMFTRHALNLDLAQDETTPFGKAHRTINGILNCLAPYSAQAELNAHETCEFPEGMAGVGGKCLIFDAYPELPSSRRTPFGLLAAIEIHRSEMTFAREHGGQTLLERLRAAGHYPYSDLDREPVA